MTKNSNSTTDERLLTGIPNLDAILNGGIPRASVVVIGGPPGTGKTILSHQIGFYNARPDAKVIFFQTLGEPTAKRLRYLKKFRYFDQKKLDSSVRFIDLSGELRSDGVEQILKLIIEHIKRERPVLVVIDSFKAFDDLVGSIERHRKFSYETVVNLMAWECTVLLLGEFGPDDMGTNPLFSVIDGIITTEQREVAGEQRRLLQVTKMRGTSHSRDHHPFKIEAGGIQLFAPKVTLQCEPGVDERKPSRPRCQVGIPSLDALLGDGIPRGSSLLVAGVAGTGKTVALIDFIYQGATKFGEKGIFFSFEETPERICAAGSGLGFDLEKEIRRGMIEFVFIPHPNILVEENILMIKEKIERLGAARIAIDSLSVFLSKVETAQTVREKVFYLARIVQLTGAVGFFSTDIPYGSRRISRHGVEESVVDGVILLSSVASESSRERFIEVYKLRNTAHAMGRHKMTIGKGGMTIVSRVPRTSAARPKTKSARRLKPKALRKRLNVRKKKTTTKKV